MQSRTHPFADSSRQENPKAPKTARRWIAPALLVIVVLAVFVLSGCGGPYRASQLGPNNIYKTDKILLLDRGLAPWVLPERIKVISAAMTTNKEGFPELRLQIANNRGSQTSMELRTVFMDANDLPVYQTAWQPAIVSANATYSYNAVCPEKTAVDYQVQIRSLK